MLTTSNGKHLKIFDDGIVVNKELPKWKNSRKRAELKKAKKRENGEEVPKNNAGNIYFAPTGTSSINTTPTSYITVEAVNNDLPVSVGEYEEERFMKVNFDDAAKMNIQELTDFINEKGISAIFGNVYYSSFGSVANYNGGVEEPNKKLTWFGKLIEKLSTGKKEKAEVYALSVIDFFENIKLIGKGSADTYKDRVAKYLNAMHTADITGQEALKQKLVKEMFVNKYEAELYANNLYYAVTEEQVVDFAIKTEKGVDLIYLKNFARPLPEKVVQKLVEVDSLEVFDNYVVLTYDPQKKDKIETEADRDKRKDPILFGLISGSDKLYYVTDWIDDYCDLTLAQFVDTLKIEKKDLKMK